MPVAALALVGATGTTASAAEAGTAELRAPAPTCVEVNVDKGTLTQTAYVYNWCSSTQRVKVLWAFAADSACTSLPPNYYFSSKRGIQARFDGVNSC